MTIPESDGRAVPCEYGDDCGRCSGEYCETHGNDPCDCDVVDRHTVQRALLTVAPRTLKDYRPQHDEDCAIYLCRHCGGRLYRGQPPKACICHGLTRTPKPCSCGLDALLTAAPRSQGEDVDAAALLLPAYRAEVEASALKDEDDPCAGLIGQIASPIAETEPHLNKCVFCSQDITSCAGEVCDPCADWAVRVIEKFHAAFQDHAQWCGFNRHAPGSSSFREAMDTYQQWRSLQVGSGNQASPEPADGTRRSAAQKESIETPSSSPSVDEAARRLSEAIAMAVIAVGDTKRMQELLESILPARDVLLAAVRAEEQQKCAVELINDEDVEFWFERAQMLQRELNALTAQRDALQAESENHKAHRMQNLQDALSLKTRASIAEAERDALRQEVERKEGLLSEARALIEKYVAYGDQAGQALRDAAATIQAQLEIAARSAQAPTDGV